MKYFVYILFSKKDHGLYVGHTSNLQKRLKEHNSGQVRSTSKRIPIVLIYKESFGTRRDAMKRERFLKSLYGSREKQKILKKFLANGYSKSQSDLE